MGRVIIEAPDIDDGALLKLVRKRMRGDGVSPISYAQARGRARDIGLLQLLETVVDHDDLLSYVSTDLVTIVEILSDPMFFANAKKLSSDLLKPLRRIVRTCQRKTVDKAEIQSRTIGSSGRRAQPGKTPSERYGGETRAKFKRKDWESVTVRDLIDWWCWRYRRAFGEEDDSFLRAGALKKHDAMVKKYKRQLFGGVTERMVAFLNVTMSWWRARLRRGESFPTGYPSLKVLLESDAFLKRWRSGAMEKELSGE